MSKKFVLVTRNPQRIPEGLRVTEILYYLEATTPVTEEQLRSLAHRGGLKIVAIETWDDKGGYIFTKRNSDDS